MESRFGCFSSDRLRLCVCRLLPGYEPSSFQYVTGRQLAFHEDNHAIGSMFGNHADGAAQTLGRDFGKHRSALKLDP